ncbi:hypothetical protein [Mycobacterium haemophilum]|uniref:Uncharacterized protein n=1 Tax=Mycobacterium haemophilum TaxID=29311 RepID=A0A0I9UH76_9MYCO|nr:hypothetical protein [Mycobacterium haemophilum]KLO31959.1 hypothetical protein ABH39_08175 [Mycobacterium haemophilum]KLO36310.1 hypothetical protein ABH38_12095 [Mycobacterium haemophilum]KLO42194.1 hypothetical protein ABH37_10725 [Mycobacterium haemophilum]KLO49997.1 hypothetical protein ABH36_08645 [Mycobacterium haemophilum]
MSAVQKDTRAEIDIADDVEMLSEQAKALKELGVQDKRDPVSEGQRYDFSIRWGTALAGRLRRLVHYSSLGLLSDADERRFHALCDELRALSDLIDRFELTHPIFTAVPPATAKHFRRGQRSRP